MEMMEMNYVSGGSQAAHVTADSHLMRSGSRDYYDEIDAAFGRWLQHDEPGDMTPPVDLSVTDLDGAA